MTGILTFSQEARLGPSAAGVSKGLRAFAVATMSHTASRRSEAQPIGVTATVARESQALGVGLDRASNLSLLLEHVIGAIRGGSDCTL